MAVTTGIRGALGALLPRATRSAEDEQVRAVLKVTFAGVISLGAIAALFLVLAVGRARYAQALLAAFAAAAAGGFVGFLFGIPRTGPGEEDGQGPAPNTARQILRPNTNLERLSDALTKMLIGVTFTQLYQLGPVIRHISELIKDVFGSRDVAGFCIITFSIWGFFASYLAFRMFFTMAFTAIDAATGTAERAKEAEKRDDNAQAAKLFQTALAELPSDAPPATRRQYAESAAMNALYREAPDGYRQAVEVAKDYNRGKDNLPSGPLNSFLAAAYGQQWKYERDRGAAPERLREIEKLAFDAAREAIRIDPSQKAFLRALWDPAQQVGEDDDLQVFHHSKGQSSQEWSALLA